MDKYEHFNTAPSPEYDMYTEDYIRTLFTLFNPVQSYRYPTTSLSSSYVPTYKTQATQSEVSLQARENAVRYLLNFHQIEVLRCLPWHRRSARTGTSTQKRRLNLRTPDYWELNRRRPSVIRRSIKGGAKCSSPREAVLEPNFETHHEMKTYQEITPVTPNYPQSNRSFIRKDPHLSTNNSHSRVQNYPQFEASVIPEDPHIIHKVPQRECQKSRVIQTTVPFTPRESQHDHVIQPTITKRPFVSTGPHSAEDKKSPTIPKKQRYSRLQSTEASCDPSSRNDTKMPVNYSTTAIPRHGNPMQAENPQRRDPLSIESTTNTKKHSDFEISKNSSRNSSTPKPDHTNLGQSEASKKDKRYKYSCFHCKKRFRWFSHWQAHERIHTGVRPFKCNQCNRSFTRGDGLQAHMVIHSSKKPHKCSTCSKLFARKSVLERHIVEHTGIIPYTCEVCQDEILDPESIEEHLAQHKTQKKFACQYCKRCFVNGRRLVRHIRAHTGKMFLKFLFKV